MNTPKHTPGPWITNSLIKRHDVIVFSSATGHRIAKLAGPNESYAANAQLIATAPELLKALQDLCEAYRISSPDATEHHAYKQARAALVKAKGAV